MEKEEKEGRRWKRDGEIDGGGKMVSQLASPPVPVLYLWVTF
jgi:hypothetical protein